MVIMRVVSQIPTVTGLRLRYEGDEIMKPTTILLLILAIIVLFSVIGLILSLVGAIAGLAWRFIFSPIGVIALIILVVYLLKNRPQ